MPENERVGTSSPSLEEWVADCRSRQARIVFTNGCFDILHAGHIFLLRQARSHGDVLVVGLNSDESVRKNKGPSRPINSAEDRKCILEALRFVDRVEIFEERTPLNLIRRIRPDVLVKGADYRKEEIVGAREVEGWGGKVVRGKLLPGRSTTDMLQAASENRTDRASENGKRSERVVAVIPARFASKRFPGKMLAPLGGKPLIRVVAENVKRMGFFDDVIVAVDDEKIAKAAKEAGVKVCMTRDDLPSGTDRIASALRGTDASIVVNVQGDEPFLKREAVEKVIEELRKDSRADMGTLAERLEDEELARNPNITKVVMDEKGFALYFSRVPIPYRRDREAPRPRVYYKHVGLYVFRRSVLEEFSRWKVGRLEREEKLEQLRFLEQGKRIKVVVCEETGALGIDLPEDLARAEKEMKKENE